MSELWTFKKHNNSQAICYTADEGASNECVSQEELAAVRSELATVRTEMGQLHSQLHYWQNVTVNILKDHYSQGMEASSNNKRLTIKSHFRQ